MTQPVANRRTSVVENRYVVQFPHPGKAHRPDDKGLKQWTLAKNGHGRLFVEQPGAYLEHPHQKEPWLDKLHFWCEWECQAEVVREFSTPIEAGYPRYAFRPYIIPQRNYSDLANTDPCVFGRVFRYCVCKMTGKMQNLARGSVILFGSKLRERFVLDTVFVIGKQVLYDKANWRSLKVEPQYLDASLAPIFDGSGCADDRAFKLYEGATFENPIDGMFSFFPCRPTDGSEGFARPKLKLSGVINPKVGQGVKYYGPLDSERAHGKLSAVVRQVKAADLCLGIRAKMPRCLQTDSAE